MHNMRNAILAALFVLSPGCTSDIAGGITGDPPAGGDDTGGDGSAMGSSATSTFSASVDQTAVDTELGKQIKLMVTVVSEGTFAGTVTATPAPITGWTMSANPPSVTMTAGGTQQIEFDVMIPTDDDQLTPAVALGLSDGTNSISVSSAFTVKNVLTIDLDAVGSTSGLHATWPLKNDPIRIKKGATVTFHNSDTVPHEIHVDGGGGIPHEGGALNAGADYTTTNVQAEADWYCHDHESGADTRAILVE